MKIYTKTGDQGKTSLFGGTKVFKNDARLNAYGTIDELNSYIGLVRDVTSDNKRRNILLSVQETLFDAASTLASESERALSMVPKVGQEDIELLEKEIDQMEAALTPLKSFILPGGHIYVSYCHIARTVCRRAERETIHLTQETEVDPKIIMFLNRLSDFLFVLSRKIAAELEVEEVKWKGKK